MSRIKDAIIRKQPSSVRFGFYTDQDVRARSILEVTSPVAFDPNHNALPHGLYDPRLGPVTVADPPCPTCCLSFADCPGHAAHVELAVPVHHPLLLDDILSALRSKCLACHSFRLADRSVQVWAAKFVLVEQGEIQAFDALDDQLASAMSRAREAVGGTNNKVAANRAAVAALTEIVKDILSGYDPDNNNTRRQRKSSLSSTAQQQSCLRLKKMALQQLKTADRCSRCGAHSPKLRHDSHNKIFQKALAMKHVKANAERNVQLVSALQQQQQQNSNNNDSDDESNVAMDIDDSDDDNDTSTNKASRRDKFMHTSEVQAQLHRLWEKEPLLCRLLWGNCDKYFLQAIPVPPSRFRPPMHLNGMSVEHAQTQCLSKILLANATTRDRLASGAANESGAYAGWIELQTAVNVYMDSSKDPAGLNAVQNGIRQILERKEGLFRKNMMGKRVNHACRSVISPDPYVGTNEIGLPRYFAETLTYPTPVTERNVHEMRVLVERGPHQYPGARWVDITSGGMNATPRRINLGKMTDHQRQAVAAQLLSSPTVVGRQLRDGDYVLMNRQPTLHKPGIMAHRVRVLYNKNQKTIRMHYANCNTYNADFDGDEMNCHFPQSDLARAEAQYIAQTDLQYIAPTDGSPLRGLIQDHVVGGVKMTSKNTFFEKWEYQQLLFAALSALPGLEIIRSNDNIEMLPPATLKPRELWTGKQVVSTLLLHLRKGSDRDSENLSNFPGLSMKRKSKTPDNAFGAEQQEHLVLIRDGELLRGVLDKAAFGSTDFSLVHAVYEGYGPEKAGLLLNALGRLFTAYIQFYSGHSCRMEDLVLTSVADTERRHLVQRAYNLGARAAKAWADSEGGKISIKPVNEQVGAEKPLKPVEAASAAAKIGLLLSGTEGKENFAALDGFMQGQLNPLSSEIVRKSLPGGLAVPFPFNTFGIMTTTGAKGSIVNQSQVTCALGQQALEGRRVPRMSSGRTLPSFAPYDPNPRADGFVMDRFLTGIRPQEYYFHCMAGREGLVDTAVKTSRSGYLQRCLVKHLEELKIEYDYTVRNAEGNVIQFLYGEDGLDPTKASYLDCSDRSFEYMARNFESVNRHNPALPTSTLEYALKDAKQQKALEDGKRRAFVVGEQVEARRLRSGKEWVRGALCKGWNLATVIKVHSGAIFDIKYDSDGHVVKHVPIEVHLKGAGGLATSAITGKAVVLRPCVPDPILSSTSRGHRLGASGACVSEKLASAAAAAMKNGGQIRKTMNQAKLSKEELAALICAKFSCSMCSPGEAVGSIAAQSVGEPSTQMTLNTFHLAGSGANVTLGIPRLREIIMTASRSLKTPTMSVPLNEVVTEKQAVRLARNYTKLSLMDFIAGKRGVCVTERLESDDAGGWLRAYYVVIKFHPAERIREAFGLTLHDIARVVAKNFVPLLSQLMKKELKRSAVESEGSSSMIVGGETTEYFDERENIATEKTLATDDELNDDENDADDAPGEEDGVEFGRKTIANYDDEGEEVSEDESDESLTSPSQLEQSGTPEESYNLKESPKVHLKTNSIALQGLKVEPNVRPLLMVGLVEQAASTILVRSRKNIDRAFINDEVKRGRCLQTAGVNFEELWKLNIVKHDELLSNDIWAVRCAYGVEAARSNIMEQIRSVFGAYGIEVDPRHLSLIADYMTFDGGFKPMSRIGIEDSSSTLLQMSFETTGHFMKKAALTDLSDNLQSPSANIVVGRPIRHGTGAFSLLAST